MNIDLFQVHTIFPGEGGGTSFGFNPVYRVFFYCYITQYCYKIINSTLFGKISSGHNIR